MLSPQEIKVTKASRKVEIQLIDRSPGSPMWMGGIICTFIEISSPHLTGNWHNRTHIFFKQGKRDGELDKPDGFFDDFRINHCRQRMKDFYLPCVITAQGSEFFESGFDAGWVDNICGQQAPAAIELEIEVPSLWFGLNKKFNTTVFKDIILKSVPDASDISIPNLEQSV